MRRVKRGLIVEDDRSLAAVLGSFMQARADVVHIAGTRRDAEQRLGATPVDAAFIDLALPDGSGVEILDLLWRQPHMPVVIVITGSATPDLAFRLAQDGVRDFVPKPLDLESLERTWDEALARGPDVRPFLRASVGRVGLHTMEEVVRRSMTEEALAVTSNSRRRASSLLGISRQLLQHILRGRPE